MLAQAGVPIFDIAKLMGHSDIRITMKVYAHLLPENLKSAVSKIKL
jgi:integrase